MALRSLYAMHGEPFTIFHAGELDLEDTGVTSAVASLKALPHVEIENLSVWHRATYGNDTDGLAGFKGYFCKVGALLAAPYDIVTLIDLDAALMENPFSLLMDTDVFRDHGHYLFRDRRSTSSETSRVVKHLERFWRKYHPSRERELAPELLNSPPFTGWSHDYGESAVVLIDKCRNVPALTILEHMVGPGNLAATKQHVHGDKEAYWQAVALAGQRIGMNPYSWAAVGTRNAKGEACCHINIAQWVWLSGRPQIFYLNGDGVDDLISGDADTLLNSYISRPVGYFHSRNPLQSSFCSLGAMPLPAYALGTLNTYRLLHDDFDSLDSKYEHGAQLKSQVG